MTIYKVAMLRDWWIGRRNALLASPRFQRLALCFAPTRPVARRHAARLFDIVAGFTYSQTLMACVELDLFGKVADEPAATEALALECALPPSALERLVGAAVSLKLLDRLSDGRVTLGTAGAAMAGNPGIAAMVAHHRHLYADLADPVKLLRQPGGGALAAFWAYARDSAPEAVAEYSALMAASQPPVAAQLLDAYDLSRHRRLLDVGGGEGAFLAKVRERAPRLDLGLFDLPAVTERAARRLGSEATVHPGDFRQDPLPQGYDCMTLVRVLHDHDNAVAGRLLRSIHAALPAGGTALICEPMSGTADSERVGGTYFAFYLLAMGTGRARSPEEIGSMLLAAGFASWKRLPTTLPLTSSVLIAQKM